MMLTYPFDEIPFIRIHEELMEAHRDTGGACSFEGWLRGQAESDCMYGDAVRYYLAERPHHAIRYLGD